MGSFLLFKKYLTIDSWCSAFILQDTHTSLTLSIDRRWTRILILVEQIWRGDSQMDGQTDKQGLLYATVPFFLSLLPFFFLFFLDFHSKCFALSILLFESAQSFFLDFCTGFLCLSDVGPTPTVDTLDQF